MGTLIVSTYLLTAGKVGLGSGSGLKLGSGFGLRFLFASHLQPIVQSQLTHDVPHCCTGIYYTLCLREN